MSITGQFTHGAIAGVPHRRLLPQGYALVMEGGGTRGNYSAGVFEAFLDAGILFPYMVGVSAGAANALSYASGQSGRNRLILQHYVGSPKYVGLANLLRHRSLFGYWHIFREIPETHVPFDFEALEACPARLLTGCVDCESGQTAWFEKRDIAPGFTATMASCAIPMLSPMVEFRGRKLLDGGVSAPIPIEKSIEDGNTFHVIVLTRNAGYKKPPFRHARIARLMYRKYPRLIEALGRWHEVYARELETCERLEREGKALIIRPQKPLRVGRSTRDTQRLLALHDEGHEEGAAAVRALLRRLDG